MPEKAVKSPYRREYCLRDYLSVANTLARGIMFITSLFLADKGLRIVEKAGKRASVLRRSLDRRYLDSI